MNIKKKVKRSPANADYLRDVIIESIQDKNGEEILSLDLRNLEEAVTDFFIICHVTSTTQVRAISENIINKVEEVIGERPWRKEGLQNLEWVLLDYANIVVHIFLKEKRFFYNLEDLWSDAELSEYNEH